MKIKLDENVPAGLAQEFSLAGHDVDTVLQEGLKGRPDHAIWQAAQAEKRFLITQDLDSSDIRPPGIGSGPMPRQARLDVPGVLQHVIAMGDRTARDLSRRRGPQGVRHALEGNAHTNRNPT